MGIAKTIAKNSIFSSIAHLTELGSGFVTGIILARTLGPSQYGIYAYVMWFLGLAGMIIDLGLKDMARRFIAESTGSESASHRTGFIQMVLSLRFVSALFACLIIIISSKYWARLSGDVNNQIFFIITGITIIPFVLTTTLTGIFKGFQKFEYSTYLTIGTTLLRFVLIIVFMFLGLGIREVLIINIFSLVLGVIIGILLLPRLIHLKDLLLSSLLDNVTKKRALKYAAAMAGILIVDYLAYQQAEVYLIGLYCPIDQVGFYRIALQTAMMCIAIFPTAISMVLLPAISEQFGKGEIEKIKEIYLTSGRYLMIFTLPLAAGMISLAGPIINVLYGPEYDSADILIKILVIPMALFNIASAGNAIILGINRPGFTLKISLLLAFINIGLSILLISNYGIIGAPIGKSVALVLNTIFTIRFASRNIGTAWPMKDTMKISLATLIMGLVVYVLQTRLSAILSLVICIPLGVVIYIILIFAFRVIRERDIAILKGIQSSVPQVFKNIYVSVIGFMEKIVPRKS